MFWGKRVSKSRAACSRAGGAASRAAGRMRPNEASEPRARPLRGRWTSTRYLITLMYVITRRDIVLEDDSEWRGRSCKDLWRREGIFGRVFRENL